MHELTYLTEILIKSLEFATKNQLRQIDKITIEIDQQTGFIDESVNFYWRYITENTLADSSTISVHRISSSYYCFSCQKKLPLQQSQCPHCASIRVGYRPSMKLIEIEGQTYEKNSTD